MGKSFSQKKKRSRIYWRLAERYAQYNIVDSMSYEDGSLMVWGGINVNMDKECLSEQLYIM